MKVEMDFMASNRVWDLVKLPIGVKSIGCKWVFKTKKDSLCNFERHAKTCCQRVYSKGKNRLHGDFFYCIKERFTSSYHGFSSSF